MTKLRRRGERKKIDLQGFPGYSQRKNDEEVKDTFIPLKTFWRDTSHDPGRASKTGELEEDATANKKFGNRVKTRQEEKSRKVEDGGRKARGTLPHLGKNVLSRAKMSRIKDDLLPLFSPPQCEILFGAISRK